MTFSEAIKRGNGSALIGFGQGEELIAPVTSTAASPWAMTLATSVLGAATGWVFEEIAQRVRKKKR